MHDADAAGQRERAQHEREHHRRRLRDDEDAMAAPAIRERSAERGDEEDRDLAGEADDPEEQRRAREPVDEPRLRHRLHPRADERDQLTAQEELVVAVAQRSKIEAGGFAGRAPTSLSPSELTAAPDGGGGAGSAARLPLVENPPRGLDRLTVDEVGLRRSAEGHRAGEGDAGAHHRAGAREHGLHERPGRLAQHERRAHVHAERAQELADPLAVEGAAADPRDARHEAGLQGGERQDVGDRDRDAATPAQTAAVVRVRSVAISSSRPRTCESRANAARPSPGRCW